MSPPNMQGPIQFALFYPHRQMSALTRFNFSETINLSFQPIDLKKFRNLALAFEALKKGGNMPAILNAANEAAVAAVLKNELPFYKISLIVEKIMSHAVFVLNPSLDELEQIHFETIIKSNELIRSIN
jgi:1-deoxy-D-xylulose-5-phosphate reductoisomerase